MRTKHKGICGIIGAGAVLLISQTTDADTSLPPSYGYAANYPDYFSVSNNHVCAIDMGRYDYWNTPLVDLSANDAGTDGHYVSASQNAFWATLSGGSRLVTFNANGSIYAYTTGYTQDATIGSRWQPLNGSAMIQSYMGSLIDHGGDDCVYTYYYTL
jgi:hypothetical protein